MVGMFGDSSLHAMDTIQSRVDKVLPVQPVPLRQAYRAAAAAVPSVLGGATAVHRLKAKCLDMVGMFMQCTSRALVWQVQAC